MDKKPKLKRVKKCLGCRSGYRSETSCYCNDNCIRIHIETAVRAIKVVKKLQGEALENHRLVLFDPEIGHVIFRNDAPIVKNAMEYLKSHKNYIIAYKRTPETSRKTLYLKKEVKTVSHVARSETFSEKIECSTGFNEQKLLKETFKDRLVNHQQITLIGCPNLINDARNQIPVPRKKVSLKETSQSLNAEIPLPEEMTHKEERVTPQIPLSVQVTEYHDEVSQNLNAKIHVPLKEVTLKEVSQSLNAQIPVPREEVTLKEGSQTSKLEDKILASAAVEESSCNEKTEVDKEPKIFFKEQDCANKSSQRSRKLKSFKIPFQMQNFKEVFTLLLENLLKKEPESIAFHQQADSQSLQRPMNLIRIKEQLNRGHYQDPWQFVEDVWLCFHEAFRSNRKSSLLYRQYSKLSEEFKQEIDNIMQSLGYCCGKMYVFQTRELCCYGRELCTIPWDAMYWSYQNKYTYCQECFEKISTGDISLRNDQSGPPISIKKEHFVFMKNDRLQQEPFVECTDCGRKMHKICVLHFDEIWPEGFTCDTCLKKSGRKKKKNKFTAKRLQQSKLGQHIENRVNKLLRSKKCEAGAIAIRVVSSLEKFAKVEPGMRARYVDAGKFPERFPYRAKALFAFEEIDEVDTCFFGMHVQEYGSECSPPNKRRVYISYLDSVHFFTSKQYRTAVYHEILLGYLDYVKQLGYTMAHIWACPPIEGDDYIFHSHPKEQKVPSSQQLEKWYKKMLDKGIAEQIVLGYKDILAQAIEDNIKSPSDLPYFDGDMWPLVLEESIRDMDDEEKRQMSEVTAASAAENEDEDSIYEILTQLTPDEFKSFFELPSINRDDSPKRVNSASAAAVEDIVNDKDEEIRNKILLGKVFPIMEKYKERFISIKLQPDELRLRSTLDDDPLISCQLMDGRKGFLTLSRKNMYEFSSLRRAKFATLALLYHLHNYKL